jgi:hypothetical protein
VGFQGNRKLTLLIGVGPEPVFECLPQLLASLRFDVVLHCLFGYVADCSCVVTSRPQRGQASSQVVELPPQHYGQLLFHHRSGRFRSV